MSWSTYKLGSLCEITSSKRIFYSEYSASGVPFYRSKEIIDLFNRNSIATELYISEDRYNEIKLKFGVPITGDLLLTSVGTIGIPYLVKSSDRFYFKDGNLTWFRNYNCNLIDPQYLFLWISSDIGRLNLKILSMGAAQPALTISRLKNLTLTIPTIHEQRKIASILSAYDSLIENNTKRIRLLEQMAENLYKEWFVRFRFPGYENTELVDGLPKGWKMEKLKNYYNTFSGGTPSRSNENYYIGNIPWIKTGELRDSIICETEEHITEDAIANSSTKIIPPNSLLVAMYAGTNVGNLGINAIEATCNQACCVITSKKLQIEYLFYFLKAQKNYLQSISFGAAQQNISQDIIRNLKIIIPENNIATLFVKIIKPILFQIKNIQYQSITLSRQRDLLLPRLMSGKLEVKA